MFCLLWQNEISRLCHDSSLNQPLFRLNLSFGNWIHLDWMLFVDQYSIERHQLDLCRLDKMEHHCLSNNTIHMHCKWNIKINNFKIQILKYKLKIVVNWMSKRERTSLACVDPLVYQIQRLADIKIDYFGNSVNQPDSVVCMVQHSPVNCRKYFAINSIRPKYDCINSHLKDFVEISV